MDGVALFDGLAVLRGEALVVNCTNSKVVPVLDLESDSVLAIEDTGLVEKQVDLSETLIHLWVEAKLFLLSLILRNKLVLLGCEDLAISKQYVYRLFLLLRDLVRDFSPDDWPDIDLIAAVNQYSLW